MSATNRLAGGRAGGRIEWALPSLWCVATAGIIALGLAVPLKGGPGDAGFGYVFEIAGYGQAFRQGLALYSLVAAVLGAAFMFAPKLAGWRINRALAWMTFILMVAGGILMLIVPQLLIGLAEGSSERAMGLARFWSMAWLDAGSRVSLAGGLVGLATFMDAWMRRPSRAAG